MYEINIKIDNIDYKLKNNKLAILSELFVKELDKLANLNSIYKDIIINNRIDKYFDYKLTNKANPNRIIKADIINYSYYTGRSTNDHFKHISQQLNNLKKGFEKENIKFDFYFVPEIWKSESREQINDIIQNSSLDTLQNIDKISQQRNILYFASKPRIRGKHANKS